MTNDHPRWEEFCNALARRLEHAEPRREADDVPLEVSDAMRDVVRGCQHDHRHARALLVAFGAGFTWGSTVIRW